MIYSSLLSGQILRTRARAQTRENHTHMRAMRRARSLQLSKWFRPHAHSLAPINFRWALSSSPPGIVWRDTNTWAILSRSRSLFISISGARQNFNLTSNNGHNTVFNRTFTGKFSSVLSLWHYIAAYSAFYVIDFSLSRALALFLSLTYGSVFSPDAAVAGAITVAFYSMLNFILSRVFMCCLLVIVYLFLFSIASYWNLFWVG